MTTTQVVEASVTYNSLSEDFSHLDNHTRETTDTPEFKPFTIFNTRKDVHLEYP